MVKRVIPGNLKVKVKYTFDNDSTLTIEYGAVSDKDTVCNMTNHSTLTLTVTQVVVLETTY